ncbi:hypothetical protein MTYP_03023 [Methylophilaceae bacterium]|nr:hypothetical protein MTYP_03023 [Methylophilaceae bacterium]
MGGHFTLEIIMTEQLVLTLVAASVGFVSAVLFCIGGILHTSNKILLQSTPYWDFSAPVASSLAAQRAQYAIGALLLLIAFLLQVAAALASSTNPANLPRYLHTWPAIVFAVLVPIGLVAGGFSALLYKTTMRKVLRLEEERRQKEEADLKSRGSNS